MTCHYLKFEPSSPKRLERARHLFAELQRVKREDVSLTPDDPHWQNFLDDQTRQRFKDVFDFQSDEGPAYHRLWDLTSPEVRSTHSMFIPPGPWDYSSLVETILQGEYELLSLSGSELKYQPYSFPFGGTESLVEFLDAFGQTVTFDSYHQGPPPRPHSTWSYALALRLIERGVGVEI